MTARRLSLWRPISHSRAISRVSLVPSTSDVRQSAASGWISTSAAISAARPPDNAQPPRADRVKRSRIRFATPTIPIPAKIASSG
jgi:hypothetical protein